MPLIRLGCRHRAIVEAMANRHLMYNAQLDYVAHEQQAGRIMLIQPQQPLGIGRTELKADKMQRVYDLGRQTGSDLLPQILAFFGGGEGKQEDL